MPPRQNVRPPWPEPSETIVSPLTEPPVATQTSACPISCTVVVNKLTGAKSQVSQGECERNTLRKVTPQNVAALVALTLIGAFLEESKVESRVFDIMHGRYSQPSF